MSWPLKQIYFNFGLKSIAYNDNLVPLSEKSLETTPRMIWPILHESIKTPVKV